MLNNNFFNNLIRSILKIPSLPFSLKFKPSAKELEIIKSIKSSLNYNEKDECFKDYNDFKKHVLKVLQSENFYSFLRDDEISNVMFVNNRLYIIKELFYLIKKLSFKKFMLLKENNIGRPLKFFLFPYTSGNKIHHLYHLYQFYDYKNKEINQKTINEYDLIFEFGGGYGNNAQLINKMGFKNTFIVFDLNEICYMQEYYLRNTINSDLVNNNGKIKQNKINLINNIDIIKNIEKTYDKILFISCWALSETPISLRENFNGLIKKSDLLIAAQEYFMDVNNLKYFNRLTRDFKNKRIIERKIGFEKHYYYFRST